MSTPPLLVTGGAGFIGSNLADRLAAGGYRVRIYDSLARAGVEENLAWLQERHGDRIDPVIADIRDEEALRRATADVAAVFHLAAQVAVTTSLSDPAADFDVNLRGTFALLEALRARGEPVPLVFASTNKVYGDLADVPLTLQDGAWLPEDGALRSRGIGDDRPLDFHTPYGCSKGAADQYVVDYARSFGLPATVLRMSCIYGPRQRGTEDQGWVAHFLIRALGGETISIYGDGHQVRDILHVDDAVAAYIAAWRAIDRVAGRAFNLGGGPENAVSLKQVLAAAETLIGGPVRREFHPWRPGDQRYFVADSRRLRDTLGLPAPRGWRSGLGDLAGWLQANRTAPAAPVTRLAPAQPRSRDPRRVLMTTDAVGGVWTYATDLAAGMAEAGIATTLVVLGPAPDAARAAQARAIPGLRLEVPDLALDWTAASPAEVARSTAGLRALVLEGAPDLVHLNHPALAAGLDVSVPIVAACHSCLATWWTAAGEGEMPEDFRWRTALLAEGYAAADRLLAPSRAFAAATQAVYGVRPEVVANGRRGVAAVGLLPSLRERQVVLAGRLWDRAKNLAVFDAAAALADVHFRAAGPLVGPHGEATEARHAEALGTLGPAELAALLAAAPVYASPALYEPFGLAVLEAAQAGCALVLSDIPTHREIWGDAAAFVASDDPRGFADAVTALFDDPARLDALGAAAVAVAARHGLQPMIDGTRALWRQALAARTAPAEDAA
jgi:CDP-paratose 2-epimerase